MAGTGLVEDWREKCENTEKNLSQLKKLAHKAIADYDDLQRKYDQNQKAYEELKDLLQERENQLQQMQSAKENVMEVVDGELVSVPVITMNRNTPDLDQTIYSLTDLTYDPADTEVRMPSPKKAKTTVGGEVSRKECGGDISFLSKLSLSKMSSQNKSGMCGTAMSCVSKSVEDVHAPKPSPKPMWKPVVRVSSVSVPMPSTESSAKGHGDVRGSTEESNPIVIPDGSDKVSGDDLSGEELNKSDLLNYIALKKSKSTWHKTEKDVDRFSRFLADKHQEYRVLTDIPVKSLDIYVGEWILSLAKLDGSPYEPDSITSFHRSIDRHLRSKNYPYSLVSSHEFKVSKEVLGAKRKELTSMGLGNKPNRTEALSERDEELLWSSGQLGLGSPQSLFNTVWFYFTKFFGFRGGYESRQLKWGDIQVKKDEYGDEFIEFNERSTKTRQVTGTHTHPFALKAYANKTDPNKCPVRAYKLYSYHRPSNFKSQDSAFYVAINNEWYFGSTRQWYKNSPMGHKLLSCVMKKMASKAGLVGKNATNHSVRKTMCPTVLQNNVAPIIIAPLSNYAVSSGDQKKQMSHILQQDAMASVPSCDLTTKNPAKTSIPAKSTFTFVHTSGTKRKLPPPLPSTSSTILVSLSGAAAKSSPKKGDSN